MGGAPLLLAFAVVTVDYGWESDGRDGYRYIVQIPAEQLQDVERTGEITSQLPPELRGRVTSVVVRVGDGEVPRHAVPRPSESDDAEPSQVAATGPERSLLPGPEETVRGQGESSQFSYPADPEDDPERESANQPTSGDTAAAPPANGFGTSNWGGFGPQNPGAQNQGAPNHGATSAATSTNRQDAPSTSRPQSGPSTSRSETDPPASSGSSSADSPRSGFAADPPSDSRPRDNRWSSSPGSDRASASPATNSAGSAEDPPSFGGSSDRTPEDRPSTGNNTAGNGNTGNGNTASAEYNTSAGGSSSAAGNTNPPPVASPRAGSASDLGFTAEARQRLADQQLLEEVGIDADSYAFDKRTGDHLREDDPRYPLIVDYVRRMDQAAAAANARAARLSTPQPINGSRNFHANAPRSNSFGYGAPWDSPSQYQPVAHNQSPPSDRFADSAAAAKQPSRDRAAAGEDQYTTSTSDKDGGGDESPSDAGATGGGTNSHQRSLTAQPLFNFMLLLSLVGNIYLGIAISRLIRRYRNLVSTQRGGILPGQ